MCDPPQWQIAPQKYKKNIGIQNKYATYFSSFFHFAHEGKNAQRNGMLHGQYRPQIGVRERPPDV